MIADDATRPSLANEETHPSSPSEQPTIGVLMVDAVAPFVPGSVSNPVTYSAPVHQQPLPGMTNEVMLSVEPGDHTATVITAAAEAAAVGAEMVTANCGFMLRYQRTLQGVTNVPVALSSLLLIPLLQSVLPLNRKLGIVTASSLTMTNEFLRSTGLDFDADRIAITGLQSAHAFDEAFVQCTGTIDLTAVEAEVVQAATDLVAREPSVGGLLLECSELPTFAAAVQDATKLPVYDFTSLIEFVSAGLRRERFPLPSPARLPHDAPTTRGVVRHRV